MSPAHEGGMLFFLVDRKIERFFWENKTLEERRRRRLSYQLMVSLPRPPREYLSGCWVEHFMLRVGISGLRMQYSFQGLTRGNQRSTFQW